MEKDRLFEKLEHLLNELGDKQLPKTMEVTIYYSTGERDIFEVSEAFWANMLVETKNRCKYVYYQNCLINIEHVVKMEFKKINDLD